ncbi:MAG: universal stress protein [Acidobacteriota bacterium]|nr:universal stress protein [Acidobacteriota bacterium]
MSGPLLLCFDGSPEAAAAIRTAGGLMVERRAIVLNVVLPASTQLGPAPLGGAVAALSGLYREWDEAADEVAQEQAQRGCEIAREAGLDARPLVARGRPAAVILEVAEEHEAGAIVLGAGHHGAVGLLGSVSARVAHLATRPVLVVPAR